MKVSWGNSTSGPNRVKVGWLAAGLCLSLSVCGSAFAQGGVTNNTDPDVALVTTSLDGANAVRSNGDGSFDIDLLFTVTNPNTITTPTPNVFDSITRLVLPIGGSTFDSATLSQAFVFTPNVTGDGNDFALPLLNGDVLGAPVYNGSSVSDITPNGTTVALDIPLQPTQPGETAPSQNVREFRIAIRGYDSNGSSGPFQLIQSSGPAGNKNICSVLNRNTTSSARCEIVGLAVTLPTSSIGDKLFIDANGDGVQVGNEAGIQGVTVDLIDNNTNAVVGTRTTDANGNYLFTGLSSGNYRTLITDTAGVLAAAGFTQTFEADGTLNGSIDTNLSNNTQNLTRDFGYVPSVNIGDTVFEDRNNNGVQDAGEPGVGGVTVTLTDSTGASNTTTTAADGTYGFTNVPVGSTTVAINVPANFVNTFDRDGGLDNTSTFTITGDDLDFDFGIQGQAIVGDTVFNDTNGNGVQDAGEPGIAGVPVTFEGGNIGTPITVNTDVNGKYSVTVPFGDGVTATIVPPAGFEPTGDRDDTNPTNVVTPNTATFDVSGNHDDVDFALQERTAAVGDNVYIDANGDGVQQQGETGIDDVTVTLTGGQLLTPLTETTANGGTYNFTGLAAGSYTVTVGAGIPAGFVITADPDADMNGNSDVTLVVGQVIDTVDFGYQPQGSVGDTVFNDLNGNGVQDANEPGLPGIIVFADVNGNDTLDPTDPQATTDPAGKYLLTNVPADMAVTIIVVEGPAGFEPTSDLNGDNVATDTEFTLSLAPGENNVDVDFGFQGLGVVGDTVFNDFDGDGVQDSNEPGIPGVTVTLMDANGAVSTTTTNGSGVYGFQNVPIGGTTVTITPPTGFEATNDRDGVADNSSTAIVGTTGDLDFDFGLARPVIGIAKQASASTPTGTAGEFETTITLNVSNLGGLDLSNVSIVDDLSTVFAAPTTFNVVAGSVEASGLTGAATYNGAGNNVVATGSLARGLDAQVSFRVRYQPNGSTVTTYNNQAVANGEGPNGTQTTDDSDNGTDPDPNDNGDPGDPDEDDPTPITPTLAPQIAIAKQATPSIATANVGEFRTTVTLLVANIGNTVLNSVSVVDDLSGVFGSPATFSVVPNTVTANNGLVPAASFDGSAANSTAATGTLAIGATSTVTFDVLYQPNSSTVTTYINQAIASGESPAGTPTTDQSDDGTEPDPNGNGDPGEPGENDPTPITPALAPQIAIAKQASVSLVTANAGEFTTTITLNVANIGNTPLTNVSIIDDLSGVFASPASFTVVAGSVTATTLTEVAAYDGSATNSVLATGDLAIGATDVISFDITYRPNGSTVTTYNNQAVATGESPTGTPTTDNSDDGTIPDPNGNGDPGEPGEDDPTPIEPPAVPQIGIAKVASASVATGTAGQFETTITLNVENLGVTPLNNIVVTDDLSGVFAAPATFTVSSVTANGGLTTSAGYDGTATNSTVATGSLAVGSSAQVTFVISYFPNVDLTNPPTYINQAVATGDSPAGVPTTDQSDDGTDPDPNGNGNPDEPGENDPTPISPPRVTNNGPFDLVGVVFNDVNGNGVNDSEAGVPGVTVTLLDNNGDPVGATTTTDQNGQYVFTSVVPGDYSVRFTQPNNTDYTAANVGSDEAIDSDVDVNTGETAQFTVDETLADVNNAISGLSDAGIVARVPNAIDDLMLDKVVNKSEVAVGDTVRYTITVTNPSDTTAVLNTTITDRSPGGFLLIGNSVSLVQGGVVSAINSTPANGGGPIDFGPIANIAPQERLTITYLMRVGSGVIGDEQINRAQAFDGPSGTAPPPNPRSNEATAVVRLAQDPIFDKTTIIGKVFHDRDGDGWQDNASANGVAVILGTPSLYVPGSVTVDYGRGPQRVSADLSRGITIGEISGRTSVADPFEFHRVTVRAEMNSAQLDNVLVGTREGTRVQLSANDVRSEGHVGEMKHGRSGQDIRVTRMFSGNTMVLTITNHGIHEEGLPGVRLATVGGLLIETDQHGRYHVADVDGGRMSAGRNYILKVDPYTLPRNSTFTTENPRVLRITRALMNKINFGVRIPVEEMKNEKIIEARLGEVFFDTDRDTIRPEYRPVIAKMARTIMKYRSGRLAIEGHADKRHNARYNLDLARRRAASVRSALEKLLPPGTFRNVEIFVDSPQEVIQNQMDTNEAHPEWRDSQTSAEPRALWNRALGAVLGLMVSTAHADEIVFTDPSMSEPFMTEVRESFNGGGTVFEDALLKAGARTGQPWALRLELRDGESSELIDAIPLSEGSDYDIDVNGGRVTLRQPMHELIMARSDKVSDGKQVYLFADNDPLTVTLAYADIEDLQRSGNNDNVVGNDVAGYDVEVISRGEGDPRANQLSTSGLQDNRRVDVRAKWRVALPNGGAIWLTEDPLQLDPRLDVVATSTANIVDGKLVNPVEFATYTNYGAFIDRWELLIFGINDDDMARPLALVKGNTLKNGEPIVWRGSARAPLLDDGQMKYVMRVYDARGRYDETAPRVLQFFNGEESDRDLPTAGDIYGLSNIARRIIPIHGSRIRMYGRDLASNNSIRVNGDPVPVEDGRYVAEWLMPVGEHAFNIDLTDENGNNWPRQLVAKVDGNAFFAVAIADITVGQNNVSGSSQALQNDDHFDEDTFVDGRFAFYVKAKRAAKYTITAQMDTREDELGDLFDDIHKKDARTLVRRLDADRYYGTYGDDSTTVSDVDSYGRIYGRVEWDNSQALWGNYATGFTGTELSEFNRSLYGAQLRYNSVDQTRMGDNRTELSAFAAEQQTTQGYNRFLGTGGSLYYLSNQDVVQGSEKISVEVRSRDSDRVLENITLERGLDYEIDDIQGRVILARPLHQVARRTSPQLVKDQPLDGDQVFLVVDYEYVPVNGFNADKGTYGVRGKRWIGDNIAIGGTYTTESRDSQDSELKGIDLVFKAAKGTYIKAEYAETEAQQALENQLSNDGGLNFTGSQFARAQQAGIGANRDGQAYSVEARYNGLDYGSNDVQIAAWSRKRNDQFSSARYNDGIDTEEFGAELDWALTSATRVSARYVDVDREGTSEERVAAVQLATDLTEKLTVSAEVQNRDFLNNVTNASDDSTRGALGVNYEVNRSWTIYGIGQGTFDGDTNDLLTLGVRTGVTDRLSLILEGSSGNKGEAIEIGADYRLSDTQEVYGSYTLSTDRTDGERNVATVGNRRQISNQLNVFNEFQFSHGERNAGIGHVFGIDYDTEGGWTVGLSAQHSNLKDSSVSNANAVIERSAATITTRYRGDKTELYTKAEFRSDNGAVDRDQWLGVVRLDRKVSENFRWLTKFAYSFTEQQGSDLDDARFAEFDLGFAYRPVLWDRWNILGKYTFLSDSGAFDGTTTATTQAGQANVRDEERSHVVSLEGIYDISRKWELGAKYAWKRQETRLPGVAGALGRDEGPWSEAKLNLGVLRLRYHMLHNWDGLAEYRVLLTDDDDAGTDSKKAGGLLAIYRHLGSNFKVGVGYNFTDFSDDLTRSDDYDASGWFINLIGKY